VMPEYEEMLGDVESWFYIHQLMIY
jgi:hypothetical protein